MLYSKETGENTVIQSFTVADIDRIIDMKPEGWEDLRPAFRFYHDMPFCLPMKMEEKGKIMALGSLIRFPGTAWLGHIIVAPQWRRNGLGERMTKHLIGLSEKNGCTRQLLIATDMGSPVYEKLGFQTSQMYHFYDFPEQIPKTELSNVRPMVPGDWTRVYDLDRNGSGEDRKVLLDGFLKNGWVYSNPVTGALTGYYLPELGDGIIVAQDHTAGEALMTLRCQHNENRPVIPANNSEANTALSQMGCTLKASARRMVRNGDDPLKPDMLFNRIGGYLG